MLGFNEYSSQPSHLDDWGPDSQNKNLISEAGLSRLLRKFEGGEDFAILTAYRGNLTKKKNIQRNRQLRGELNKRKMGVYQLVGHWQECELTDVDYDKCPKDKLKDVIERSYMTVKPKDMSSEDFEKLIVELIKRFDQDGAVLKQGNYKIIEKNGNKFDIGSKLSLGKISQGYSQHVKKMNVPFTFEGVEVPGTIIGRRVMTKHGIRFPIVETFNMKEWNEILNA
tara:strand:+ start:645 stop:1319 length:675 start_codon:yes stop_codon:yes gene_type:complete